MSSLMILAASFLDNRADKQTDNPTPSTAVGVGWAYMPTIYRHDATRQHNQYESFIHDGVLQFKLFCAACI